MTKLTNNGHYHTKGKNSPSDVTSYNDEATYAISHYYLALSIISAAIWLRLGLLSIYALTIFTVRKTAIRPYDVGEVIATKVDLLENTPTLKYKNDSNNEQPERRNCQSSEIEAQIKKRLSKIDERLTLKSIHRDTEDDNPVDDFIAAATAAVKLKVAQVSSWIASYYAFYKAKYYQTAFTGLRWELTKNYYSHPQDFSGCKLSVTELKQLFKLGVRDFRRVTIQDPNGEFNKESYNGCLFYQAQLETAGKSSADIFQHEITDLDLFKLEYQARTGQSVENLEAGILSAQELAQRQQNNSASEQNKLADDAPMTITEMKQVMLSAPSLNSHRCMGNLAHKELTSGQLAYLQSRGVKHFESIKCQQQDLTGLNLDNQYFDGADFSGSDLSSNASRNSFYSGATLPANTGFFTRNNEGTEVSHTCNDKFTKVTTKQAIDAVLQAELAGKVKTVMPSFKVSNLNQENITNHCLEIISRFTKSNLRYSRTFSRLFKQSTPRLAAKNYLIELSSNSNRGETTADKILEHFEAIHNLYTNNGNPSRKMPKYIGAMQALLKLNLTAKPADKQPPYAAA